MLHRPPHHLLHHPHHHLLHHHPLLGAIWKVLRPAETQVQLKQAAGVRKLLLHLVLLTIWNFAKMSKGSFLIYY